MPTVLSRSRHSTRNVLHSIDAEPPGSARRLGNQRRGWLAWGGLSRPQSPLALNSQSLNNPPQRAFQIQRHTKYGINYWPAELCEPEDRYQLDGSPACIVSSVGSTRSLGPRRQVPQPSAAARRVAAPGQCARSPLTKRPLRRRWWTLCPKLAGRAWRPLFTSVHCALAMLAEKCRTCRPAQRCRPHRGTFTSLIQYFSRASDLRCPDSIRAPKDGIGSSSCSKCPAAETFSTTLCRRSSRKVGNRGRPPAMPALRSRSKITW